jgi:hypothetical protein
MEQLKTALATTLSIILFGGGLALYLTGCTEKADKAPWDAAPEVVADALGLAPDATPTSLAGDATATKE